MDRIFKPPSSMTRAMSQDRQNCQSLFCCKSKSQLSHFSKSGRRPDRSAKLISILGSQAQLSIQQQSSSLRPQRCHDYSRGRHAGDRVSHALIDDVVAQVATRLGFTRQESGCWSIFVRKNPPEFPDLNPPYHYDRESHSNNDDRKLLNPQSVIYVDIGCAMSTHHKTLTQAAKEVGVSAVTLRRWFLTKKIGEVGRDRNGWRIFSDDDVARIKAYATKVTLPEKK